MPGILGVIQRLIPRSRREVCEETLVKAAVNDCLDAEPVVRALLAHGASSNTAGNGETPLERAIQVGHGSVARMLLDHGADPNPLGENEPLLAALNQRDSETVQALIRHHVNVNAGPPGSPVLGEVDSADSNDFRLILGAGADVNQPGIVALNAAKGNVPFLQLLAEHGASLDVRWEGSTPLYASAYAGQIESVRFLLSHERDSAHRQADATDTLNRLRNSGWRNLSLLPSSAKDTVIRALQQATH
jgi:ankyrin repeat protein